MYWQLDSLARGNMHCAALVFSNRRLNFTGEIAVHELTGQSLNAIPAQITFSNLGYMAHNATLCVICFQKKRGRHVCNFGNYLACFSDHKRPHLSPQFSQILASTSIATCFLNSLSKTPTISFDRSFLTCSACASIASTMISSCTAAMISASLGKA
jgi:hypothetical protein